jgi:short subunit dehydrogenase-like uncharacterized protein
MAGKQELVAKSKQFRSYGNKKILNFPVVPNTPVCHQFYSRANFQVSVPWGDVATGFYSSGIQNITCYKAVSPYIASWLNGYTVSFFSYLSSYYYIKSFFETVIEVTLPILQNSNPSMLPMKDLHKN